MEHRTGDDTYLLPDVNASGTFYACIWDAGGTDTLAYAGTRDTTIDLRPASLEYAVGGGGYMSHALGVFGGFTIAHGVVIENATGGAGNDTLTGNDVDNHLQGGAGNDVLMGFGGNNRLDGGVGIDTAAYLQSRAGYSVDVVDGLFQVRALAGGSSDTLVQVEQLRFTEGTLLTRAATDDGLSVGGLYRGLLGRSAEADGFRFWTEHAETADVGSVARSMVNSSEFANGLGNATTQDFVAGLYGNLLSRSAEAGGLQFWMDALEAGLDRGTAALGFIASNEFREQHFAGLFGDLSTLGDVWTAA
nr:DUF4214 domain-containing protein [Pseudoroseomonas aerophila]